MGKKKGKQESMQLSFFDAYEPEEQPAEAPVQDEVNTKEEEAATEIPRMEAPEPVGEHLEEPPVATPAVAPPAKEHFREVIEKVMAKPVIPYERNRALTLTEKIFTPMVIHFNNGECPEEMAHPEEQLPTETITAEALEETTIETGGETPEETPAAEPETEAAAEEMPTALACVEKTGAGRKILITGASGFIGGYLVEAALERGYTVWAGIRANSSRARLTDERIRFIDLAFDNEDILTAQLENFREENGAWDFIIHNAGVTKTADKMDFFRVNAENTHRLIEALNRADCTPRKFILMSSLSSYGAGDEKNFTPIGLEDAQRPDTAYGLSKLEAENYVRRQTYFPYIILRPTGVYGPGDRDYFMEIKTILSGFDFAVGMRPQRITFIYVKDLATAAFLAIEREEVRDKHYFVADGDVYTDQEFARIIQELLGKKRVVRARIPSGLVYVACLFSELFGKIVGKGMTLNTDKYKILKQRNWICEVAPLRDDLGFTPAYTLRRGLQEAIAWYKEQKWL